MKNTLSLMVLATAVLQSACGGGGSGGADSTAPAAVAAPAPAPTPSPAPAPAPGAAPAPAPQRAVDGIFSGTASDGTLFNAVVLEDDQLWMIYGSPTQGGGVAKGNVAQAIGLIQGSGQSNSSGGYSATVRDFPSRGGYAEGAMIAVYSPSFLAGRLVTGGNTRTLQGSPAGGEGFDYYTPAALQTIGGTWAGTTLDRSAATVKIDGGTGVVNVQFVGAPGAVSTCELTGMVSPHAGGRNLFDVELRFGPAPCATPGKTVQGIGLSYEISPNVRQLLLMGLDEERAGAFVFTALRS